MGTLGGFASPFGPPPATTPRSLRSASPNPPALWLQACISRPWAKPAFANAIMETMKAFAAPHARTPVHGMISLSSSSYCFCKGGSM